MRAPFRLSPSSPVYPTASHTTREVRHEGGKWALAALYGANSQRILAIVTARLPSPNHRATLAFLLVAVVNGLLLWHFHDRYWYPTDDGLYANIAERLLSGEVMQRASVLIDLAKHGKPLRPWIRIGS